MADARSLLRNERAARKISHPFATYSTKGNLICLACSTQIKSEALWEAHLRTPQHAAKAQKARDARSGKDSTVQTQKGASTSSVSQSKKRKADDSEPAERKKSRAGLPDGFFDIDVDIPAELKPEHSLSPADQARAVPSQEITLTSRPATPLKTPTESPLIPLATVNEDEWAAFEADIAAAVEQVAPDAVISAPAMSAEEIAAKSREEESAQRKERQEAEMEGDKEDAARKLEQEFDEMEELGTRVKRLKEQRELLRLKARDGRDSEPTPAPTADGHEGEGDSDDDDDDDEEEDDWDSFRLRR